MQQLRKRLGLCLNMVAKRQRLIASQSINPRQLPLDRLLRLVFNDLKL